MRTIRFASIASAAACCCLAGGLRLPAVQHAGHSRTPAMGIWPRDQHRAIVQGAPTRSGPSVPGAIIGAVAGGVLGHQVGSGTGRDVATVLGAAGGAAVGSQAGRGTTTMAQPAYRVTVQTQKWRDALL